MVFRHKIFLLVAVVLMIALCLWFPDVRMPPKRTVEPQSIGAQAPAVPDNTILTSPLPDTANRVSKKTFGMYVSPKNSPVSPERFQGYHTGVDFETLTNEQDTDVAVGAVCDGPLSIKKWASGYGGVAIQRCKIDAQDVTVVYGHLRLTSIKPALNETIKAGESFAVLGKGFTSETDGERMHLHLAIHKDSGINILGYVQNISLLDEWIDPMKHL